jgi:hypothetical protein
MKNLKSLFVAMILTLALSGAALAGDISGGRSVSVQGDISGGLSTSGDISGGFSTSGDISGGRSVSVQGDISGGFTVLYLIMDALGF